MSSAPSAVMRRPARAERRAFTSGLSATLPARSKRSCTAVATLLTFWPPGPEARTKETDTSSSGISSCAFTRNGTYAHLPQSAASVGSPVASRRGGFTARRRRSRARIEETRDALRDRDVNAVGAEDPPDGAVDVRAHVVDAVDRVSDPEADLETHAVVI